MRVRCAQNLRLFLTVPAVGWQDFSWCEVGANLGVRSSAALPLPCPPPTTSLYFFSGAGGPYMVKNGRMEENQLVTLLPSSHPSAPSKNQRYPFSSDGVRYLSPLDGFHLGPQSRKTFPSSMLRQKKFEKYLRKRKLTCPEILGISTRGAVEF